MGDRSLLRPALPIPVFLGLALLLGGAQTAQAGHDLEQRCYVCHNIQSGQVWPGSYSVYSGLSIGMSPYSRPITCDICHTDYGDRFKATSESHHPVAVIATNTMSSDYDNGVVVRCKDCHNADSVALTPNLYPDLAPTHYNSVAGNDNADGYPNHDVQTPNNQVNLGDPPHLLSMLLSGGQRTVSGSATYNRVPSSSPATDYAFCLSCHDGSANTARAVNVRQDYIDKGHYFKATNAGQGITAGDRIPCSDCHGSHDSQTNARLFEPDNATFVGTRPTGKTFANPYAPTDAEYRAMCIACHDDYNATNTGNGTPTVRTVEPTPRKYGIAGHAPSDTQSCRQCHNPHKTPGGGPDCLMCHTPGGGAGTSYAYIDVLFKGVGPDGASRPTDAAPLAWSQHGGFTGSAANFLYTSPYDTKATNDCVKCHGVRHNNTYRLIDADQGDSGASAFDNTAMSLKTATVANANAFCLTCHDGNGAAGDVRIGNQVPPNVAATWATRGHGLASGSYPVSGNSAANIKCIDCHEVHGSNHARLLPADNTATGNFAMPSGKPGMTFRGGSLLASALDFANHSLPSSGDTYGTTGNPGALTSAPQGYNGSARTGLCDACHRYSAAPPAGTVSTYNKSHTHEGIAGQGNPASQMTFTKDCVECHNPHGGANANVYMVSDNIVVTQAAISGSFPVTFTDNAMFDPPVTGTALCNVCHASPAQDAALNVNHNNRQSISPDHGEGTNCTSCHAHGKTDDAAAVGFPQAGCNICHGSLSDPAGMPSATDGATYDTDANNIIGTRGGTDNTAHYIHVNYLVNKRGISRPNSCYVCHKGGGSQESPHPGNPTNTSYKTGTKPTAVPYVQVSLDNTGAVLNVQIPGLTASYSGTPGQSAADPNWKTCSNTTCHYALSPSWSGKKQISQPPGVLTVSTPDALPASGPVNAGSTGNVIDKISLSADATGLVRINEFKIRLAAGATAQDTADIAKVALWEDTNTDGVPDIQVGPDGVFSAVDNSYVVDTFFEVQPSTSRRILIVADFAPGAANGRTAIFQTVNGDITASYGTINPWGTFTSSTFTVQAPGTLTVTTPDAFPASGLVMSGASNVVIDRIALAASGGYATVSGLRVKQTGTAQDTTDIASISFWRDTNKDGTPDSILGGTATFVGLDNTYFVNGLALNIPSGTTEWVLVVDNVAATATAPRTIQTQVNNGYVTVSAGSVNPVTTFNSNTQTISTGGQLTVTTPDALPAAANLRGGSTGNVVDRINLAAASADVVVSGITVQQLGTAINATDIAQVTLWEDTDKNGTPDVQLGGAATYSAGTYTVSGLGLTVTTAASKWVLVVVDLANGATAALTVQTRVNDGYVAVSAGSVNTITPFSSNTFTIGALTGLIITDTQGSTTPVDTTSLGTNATHQFYGTATYSIPALNQDVTTQSSWERSGTATGSTIDNTASKGLYTSGTTDGTDTVTATFKGQADTTSVTVTSVVLVNQFENFESSSWNGVNWLQTTDDDSDWCRNQNQTPSGSTGPDHDKTSEPTIPNSGWYLYTEVSTGGTPPSGCSNVTNSNAAFHLENVLNPIASATAGPMQLAFWYHRYGTNMGTLQVQISNDGGAWQDMWSSSGQTHTGLSNPYTMQVIDVASFITGTSFRIRFRSSGATGIAGDGAIDDIRLWNDGSPAIAVTGLIITDTPGSTTPVNSTDLGTSSTHQFYATAQYSDSSTADVTTQTSWSRSGTAAGSTIDNTSNKGLYTSGTTAGTDTVTASYGGQNDTTSVTVSTITFSSHTYWLFNPSSSQSVGVDGNSPTGTFGATTTTIPALVSMATTTLNPGGLGTSRNFRPSNTGSMVQIMRAYVYANYTTANVIQAQTVNGEISVRAGNTGDAFYVRLYDYDPAGASGNGVQIGADSSAISGFASTFTTYNRTWTISIPANYSISAGHRLQLRVYVTTGGTGTKYVYFGTTTSGQTTCTGFTINESTTQNLAPPRLTGDTTAIACNTCHQFGPDDATAGYKDGNQYYYALPGDHGVHGFTTIGGTDPDNTAALDTCTICHLAATNTFGADHSNGTVDLRSGSIGTRTAGPGYADTGTYVSGTRRCSNLYCHAGQQTPIGATQSWGYGSTSGLCNVCHAFGLTPAVPPTGRHGRHDNTAHNDGASSTAPTRVSNASGYAFSCSFCHYGSSHVSYPVSSVRAAEVTFGGTLGPVDLSTGSSYAPAGTASGNEGGKLNWTNGSCTVYCHSNANPVGSANVYGAPTWTGTVTCGLACHGNDGQGGRQLIGDNAATLKGSLTHVKHVSATAYGFTCNQCHAGTVTGVANTTINVYDNHVNGAKNVRFSTVRATAVDQSSATYDNAARACNNTYCHSDGTRVKTGTIAANVENWTTAGPLSCDSCHGNPPAYASAANKANSHGKHPFACSACHSQTTTADNTITTAANHVNADYNVSGSGGNVFTYTFDAAGSTCAFTAGCHGTATVTWGGTISGGCFGCHAGAEQGYKPQNDYGTPGAPNPVVEAQYLHSGHGRSGSNYAGSGNLPANLGNYTGIPSDCYYCHSQGASHVTKSANDPFRLGHASDGTTGGMGDFTGAFADNTDTLCMGCHGSAADRSGHSLAAAGATTVDMLTHARGITGTKYTWPNTPWKCVDCHDPHGDGASGAERYMMVRSAINTPSGSTDTLAGSDVKSRPKRTVDANVRSISFNSLAGFASGSYAQSGNGAGGLWGPCEACHTQTNTYSRTIDNDNTHASRTGRCTSCHTHGTGFKGAGHASGSNCKGCHDAVQSARRSVRPEFDSAYQHAGTWAAMASSDCELCHLELSQDGIVILKQWTGAATYNQATYDNANLAGVNAFCLSCHDGGAYNKTFTVGGAPPNVGQYYSTTYWPSHNYAPTDDVAPNTTGTVFNTVPVLTKAQSPHGKPGTNDAKGTDQATFGDATPVGCLHCHPSHGSAYASPADYLVSRSGATPTNSPGGKMVGGIPSSLAGVGLGYPAEGTTAGGESFCWACHDFVGVNDMYGDRNAETASGNTGHWTGTWTRPAAPFAYKNGDFRSSHFYPSKGGSWSAGSPGATTRTNVQCLSCHDPHGSPGASPTQYYASALKGTWLTSPYKEDRVPVTAVRSPTAGALPAGYQRSPTVAWQLQDPDRLMDPGPRGQPNKIWTNPPDVGGGYSNTEGTGTQITGDGNDGYFIDDNTFGVNNNSNPTTYNASMWPVYYTNAGTAAVYRKTIAETADDFAGLCARCHGNSSGATLVTNMVTAWSGHGAVKGATAQNDIYSQNENQHNHGMDRIVSSATPPTSLSGVRLINSNSLFGAAGFGWAVQPITQKTAGTKIKYHDFPCSKCHTPHASRLPRLMRTNCLETWSGTGGRNAYPKHRYGGSTWVFGFSANGGTAGGDATDGGTGTEAWHYPAAQNNATTRTGGRPMHCHNTAATNTGTAGQAPSAVTGGGWNAVTGW